MFLGLVFGAGLVISIKYVPGMLPEDKSAWRAKMEKRQEELGYSCMLVWGEAYSFMSSDLSELINLGAKGGDWVAAATDEQYKRVVLLNEQTYECSLLGMAARKAGAYWPDFKSINLVYGSFESFLTSWGGKPASAMNLKPTALEQVKQQVKNVTSVGM